MPTIRESAKAVVDGYLVTVRQLDKSWDHSPRVNGHLKLRSNAYYYEKALAVQWMCNQGAIAPATTPSSTPSFGNYSDARARAYAQAYARFRGKLYSGNASLGVTAASTRQSREMIAKRVDTLKSEVPQLYADALRSKRKGKDASGLILETMFGWVPLYSDIHSAATSVIQEADRLDFVRGAGRAELTGTRINDRSSWRDKRTITGTVRVTLAAAVTIENPNRWLLERAGLLNYAAVAWDIVPWSFMVNAFSNTGSIVNSLTDFSGLRFTSSTETTKWDFTDDYESLRLSGESKGARGLATYVVKNQRRVLNGTPSPPPLIFRTPELSFSTVAIGLSLVVQNFGKLKALYAGGAMTLRSLRDRGYTS